jgi:hypothetical protein
MVFSTAVTYSGSYNFNPSAGDIIITAFQRIGFRPTEILQSHLQQAVMELNLLQTKLSNQQPNLWDVDLQALPLTQGTATYSLPAETVMITNAFVRVGSGTSSIDRLIFPISQTEYAALSNKFVQAPPTQFWFNRLISPTITFYQVPDGNGPYTVYYYRVRQIQDAILPNGFQMEVPYLWLDALTAGLAHRLARVFAQPLEQIRKMDADEAWQIAATQNVENVPMYIAPGLVGYFPDQ